MRRAVLAMVLLIAAAPAFCAASAADLHLRARLLLREIREQAASPTRDTKRLRAELSALKAENSAAPDDKVSAHLIEAEADLALVDAGTPLPSPATNETIPDDDLRDAVAQPPAAAASLPRAPVFQNAGPAAMPESGGRVFDGAMLQRTLSGPSVGVPPEAPTANLDQYLALDNDDDQMDFLTAASADLLDKLKQPDETGARATFMAGKLNATITNHPLRERFISVHVTVPDDGLLHLVYRLGDGGAVDEILGLVSDWSTPSASGKHGGSSGGGKKKKKKKSKPKSGGAGGGDDDSSSNSGKKHHGGHKGHGGGGGGGGGDGGGDDGGSGGGPGGGGSSHHAKAPKSKAGGSMFDGGDDSGGDSVVAGPSGAHHGGRGRDGRKGHGAGSAGGSRVHGEEGGDDGGAAGDDGGHVHAGRTISGDDDDDGSNSAGPGKSRGTAVPLPKDFTSHGGGSPLDAEGGARGSKGEGNGAFERGGMGPLGKKDFARGVPPPAVTGSVVEVPPALNHGNAPAAQGSSPVSTAPGAAALNSPFTVDDDLRDAVAAHSASSPSSAVSRMAPTTPAAPAPASSPLPDSWPLAVACAGAIAVGAYAIRKSRQA